MGRLVDLSLVMLALDKTATIRYGEKVTQVMQQAVRDLPSPPFVPSPDPSEATAARQKAFSKARNDGEALSKSLAAISDWAKDADVTEIVSLQQMAKLVSDQVEVLANLKDDILMKQLQSIRALKN